jgi:predicted DNA-binding helix-hairpin-helix protein
MAGLYKKLGLARIYFSAYQHGLGGKGLPGEENVPPADDVFTREHRLYQADWLYRFYSFSIDEIVNDNNPNLDLEVDPKLGYALRNPSIFPIDINKADYEMILRVPGIGPRSAQQIVLARKYRKLNTSHLKKIGVVLKRAQYFITCNELKPMTVNELKPEYVRQILTSENKPARKKVKTTHIQLSLFNH